MFQDTVGQPQKVETSCYWNPIPEGKEKDTYVLKIYIYMKTEWLKMS